MKWLSLLLALAGLLLLTSYATGLIGTGNYVNNYEASEYANKEPFIEPTVIIDGLAVYMVGNGDPVLILPYPHAGTEAPMAQSDFTGIFTALGRRVITFDVPGAYASTREPRADMDEMLECALDALEAAGVKGKVDVAGHSMGGLVALAFALEHPERVDQLLLINTLSGFDASLKWGLPSSAWKWYQKEYWQLMIWGTRLMNGRGDLATHKRLMHLMHEASFVDKSFISPLIIDEEDKEIPTPVRFRWQKALWGINYASALEQVSAPTLITAGRYDPQTPVPCANELAAGIRGSRLEIFENSGHAPFIEEKEKFLDIVSGFLEES